LLINIYSHLITFSSGVPFYGFHRTQMYSFFGFCLDEGDTEGTSIFVKNLNFNTTDEKLKEVTTQPVHDVKTTLTSKRQNNVLCWLGNHYIIGKYK